MAVSSRLLAVIATFNGIPQSEQKMALVLRVRLGDCIDIGPNWIKAWAVYNRFTLIVLTSDGRLEKISSHRVCRIFGGVEIGLGP